MFKSVTVVILLAITSNGNARPRDPDPLDNIDSHEIMVKAVVADNRSGLIDSRQNKHRELKGIQNIDQSLRTVATQLLNSTKHEELVKIPEEKTVTFVTPIQVVHLSTRIQETDNNYNNNKENDSGKMKFGIPMNSKFSPFEITNPGHAMAMTDEDIEREIALAEAVSQKYRPTTTSMLSTWIQLYPPSTTTDHNNVFETKTEIPNIQIHSTPRTNASLTVLKNNTAFTKSNRNSEVKFTTTPSIITSISTTKIIRNINTTETPIFANTSIKNKINHIDTVEMEFKNLHTNSLINSTTKSTILTKKIPMKINNTLKLKITTPKNPTTKIIKNANTVNRIKSPSIRKPSKNDTFTSISKIEKVTFKPTFSIFQNQTLSTDKPYFITKIKASVLTNTQKSTTSAPIIKLNNIISKSNFSHAEFTSTKIPNLTQVNNILKVSLKKPIDDSTKIEIQPIRVNPPVLTIEKIDDKSSNYKTNNKNILDNPKIDVKFDFSPEYSNVKLATMFTESSSLEIPTTTTKRSPLSHKRKKNKNRRRKPLLTTTSAPATSSTSKLANLSILSLVNPNNVSSEHHNNIQSTAIQESKIEPESKTPPSKKKPSQIQIQKPIGTQIYNFLSREVIPSVGVMSLVGLGLGLASYFLYPFGGVIARRNYDVEPNYKYNLDEYGGNYGLNEEEVLSKVYSGMTSNQHQEPKYNSIATSENNPTYYRYTGSEQVQQQNIRYPSHTYKNIDNRVIYRPVETTSYDANYQNTEFNYPEVSTTSNYYELQRKQLFTDFTSTSAQVGIAKNRKFVVGNIPKEYSSRNADKSLDVITIQDQVEYNLPYETNGRKIISNNDKQNSDEIYEEIEITPTAVAVEHGPRFLKSFDDNLNVKSTDTKIIRKKRNIFSNVTKKHIQTLVPVLKNLRIQRSSVIQVIPPKNEVERDSTMQEQEANLSNEILNIIDDVLPDKLNNQKKKYDKINESIVNPTKKKQFTEVTSNSINVGTLNSRIIDTTTTSDIYSSTHDNNETEMLVKKIPKNSTAKATATSTVAFITTTMTSPEELTELNVDNQSEITFDSHDNTTTTAVLRPQKNGINVIELAKRIAEIKFRLGLTILKHASEGFARYIGHIQKKFNGEE